MLMAAIFCALLAMICINVPIAVALAMCGVIGLLAVEGTGSLVTIALDMYDGSTKFSLIAIPMFVLAGAIMNAGGITDRLINLCPPSLVSSAAVWRWSTLACRCSSRRFRDRLSRTSLQWARS